VFLCLLGVLVVEALYHRPLVYIPGLGGSKLIATVYDPLTGVAGPMSSVVCSTVDLSSLAGRSFEVWPSVAFVDGGPGTINSTVMSIYCRAWLLQMSPDPFPTGDIRVDDFVNVTVPGFGGYGVMGLSNLEVQMWLRGYVLGENYRTAYWDWRQTPPILDNNGWMAALQTMIEGMVSTYSHSAVILAHSSGNHLAHYFFTEFLESEASWKEEYVHWYVCVASGLGGFPAGVGAGAMVMNAEVVPLPPDGQLEILVEEMFMIGLTPFMVWAQPQTSAWEGLYPYEWIDTSAVVHFETCEAWTFPYVLNETGVNDKVYASPANTLIWPAEDFFVTSPGVNTTIICGYGQQTLSTVVYEDSEPLLGLPAITPTDFVYTPDSDGDDAIPEQVCNCTHAWAEDPSIEVQMWRFANVSHSQLAWNPLVISTWIGHAIGGDIPTWWPNWVAGWGGFMIGVVDLK